MSKIEFSESNSFLICKLKGEIDHHFSVENRDEIDMRYERSKLRDLAFDFSDVTFMDSSGIGMLIGRYKLVFAKGGKICAFGLTQYSDRIFEIGGLKKIIEVHDSVLSLEGGL